MWRLTEQLHVTAREAEAEREKAEARHSGSVASSKNDNHLSITEEERDAKRVSRAQKCDVCRKVLSNMSKLKKHMRTVSQII